MDIDWSELIEKYHLSVTPDHLRKVAYGMRFANRANEDDGVSASDEAAYPTSVDFNDEQTLRDLRREINAYRRSDARRTQLADAIKEAVAKLPPIESPEANTDPDMEYSDGEMVLAMGDMHFGADILVEGLRGETLNYYNEQVFKVRMADLLKKLTWIASREHINVCNVFLVGDLIDGLLRESQLSRLEYGIVDQVIHLGEYLARWFDGLSTIMSLKIYGATGNHSEIRPLRSGARDFEDENLERILFWYLKARLANNPRIVIDEDCRRRVYANVAGYSIVAIHGDGAKYKDVVSIAKDSIALYGQPVDYFLCGHLHNESEFTIATTPTGTSTLIRVPSICGMDKYAQSLERGARAGAYVMILDEGQGRRCTYPISL